MNDLTLEWVDKAEADLRTAGRELAAAEAPNYDDVCFHAQQCAEKYLKAILHENGIYFGKTHDLTGLLGLALEVDQSLEALHDHCESLVGFAVNFRYPDEWATEVTAEDALRATRCVREKARLVLGIEP